ncbi:MAG: amidohydrolase family protein [Acidimicrobiales bacterium]
MAAEAGVDLILHASYLDEPAVEAMVAAGCAVAPTFTFLANLADHGALVGAMTTQVDLFRGEIQATADMLRTAYDAGVPVLCGSESGFSLTPYGHWHAREMEVLVEALGLSPLEAISCATRNGAIALRRPLDSIGVIATGAAADVLVVDGDPAADVSVLGDRRRLRHVFSRGRAVDLDRPWPERSPAHGEGGHLVGPPSPGTWCTGERARGHKAAPSWSPAPGTASAPPSPRRRPTPVGRWVPSTATARPRPAPPSGSPGRRWA